MAPAVTVGGNVHDEIDVEVGFVFDDSVGVFGDFFSGRYAGFVPIDLGGAILTDGDTLPTTDTVVIVDDCFFCLAW